MIQSIGQASGATPLHVHVLFAPYKLSTGNHLNSHMKEPEKGCPYTGYTLPNGRSESLGS